jgi:hypothetical protein
MGKGGGNKYRVVDYYMSIHYGICHGPVDALLGIFIKERDAFPGTTVYETHEDVQQISEVGLKIRDAWLQLSGQELDDTDERLQENGDVTVIIEQSEIPINKPELFGGDQKEGGAVGIAHYLPGLGDQTLPDNLAEKLGLTSATAPGFRGIASVFFHGLDGKGFMWCQNNPYLPSAWFRVFRKPVGLIATKALIQTGENMPDANPAHIIYECLTNTDWGMGAASTSIDVGAFEACGDTLFDEGFGLSLLWSQQASIEDFVKEILDHINATLFVNPRTGLLTLKLIRGDYEIAGLREFNPDNCDATNRQRKAWAETINEIVVTWTNPENEQEETLVFQDLANIAMQGEIVTDSRNYYGVRNADLASQLGVRDLRASSYPLFSCNIEVDRSAWDLLPGEVCVFSWPEDGIDQIIMRVGNINYGRRGDPTITASLVEDVFSLEQAQYSVPPRTGWVDPSEDPLPFAYTEFATVPLPLLIAAGVDAATVDERYPDAGVAILAQQTGTDTYEFILNGPYSLPNGDTENGALASLLQTSRSVTATALPYEAQTLMTQAQLGPIDGTERPTVGGFVLIGEGGETEMEMAMLDSFNSNTGQWTLARGVYDTVPRSWPVGTPVWYITSIDTTMDPTLRVAGQSVPYQLQPRTSKGLLPIEEAPVETALVSERPYLPFRPANVQVGGAGFGIKTYSGPAVSTFTATWANRNRLMEDQVVRRWSEGNVTPEVGQTTTIRCFESGTDTLIEEYAGILGTSFDIPYPDMQGNSVVDVQFLSERDGFESLQGAKRTVIFDFDGYGSRYGSNYGE